MRKWNFYLLGIGVLVTIVFFLISKSYYEIRSLNAPLSQKNDFKTISYRILEGLDFLFYDLRMQTRGEIMSQAPVILLSIDDSSIEQVGRWPWSREKIAKVTEEMLRYGAKVIGFDIVFSEPQENPLSHIIEASKITKNPEIEKILYPDKTLAQTLSQSPDQIVLGAFPEAGAARESAPYQDYCRNEAFIHYNANDFVKIENTSFVVIDNADPFEEIDFSPLFDPIFKYLKQEFMEREYPRHFEKPVTSLSTFEHRRLLSLQNQYNMEYCSRWLTDKDEFIETSEQFFSKLKLKQLDSTDPKKALQQFKELVLIYPITQYDSWTINTQELHESIRYTGSFAAHQDNDGKIRRQPLFFRTGQKLGSSFVPSLALQSYLAANPQYQAQVEINIDPENPFQKKIVSMKILNTETQDVIQELPVDGKGQLLISYSGSRNMFAYVPAKELLNNKPDMVIYQKQWHSPSQTYWMAEKNVNKADFLKDKVTIFGATATAVYDLRVTPFDKNFPGPEIHVNTIANLFDQNYLTEPRNESQLIPQFTLVLGILTTGLLTYLGSLAGFTVVTLGVIGLFGIDQWMFRHGQIVTTVIPLLLLISLFVIITLVKYFTEEKKKKELKSTFSKYVSPAIVDEILSSPEKLELGGVKQDVTIFFSDVRGFTTISEKLDPQSLSQLLNRYLTPMTEIIFKNKGTLDKYMGDAIMAFFGAPITFSNHPEMACQAALESIEKLRELQNEFVKQDLPVIDIGIGLNTAEVSVGNMGSDIVRNYTVMGDGVNLASRLEGINKEYGTRIIISHFTYDKIKNLFTCREVDRVRVKGKTEPITIYELLSRKEKTAPLMNLELFEEGLKLYYQKKFKESLQKFQMFLEKNPEDYLTKLYMDRGNEYLETPPSDNWDGVHDIKTK
jgi:adenylate cyclase